MNKHRIRILAALAVLGLGLAAPSLAAKVALQNATATHYAHNPTSGEIWHPRNTIDGFTAGGFTSWSIDRGVDPPAERAETIVWETQSDLTLDGSTPLNFAMHHQDFVPSPGHNIGRFRLSYTTDDRTTFADGLGLGGDVTANWTVISPSSASSTGGEVMTTLADTSILVSGGTNAYPTYKVSGLLAASGITGFRLEALKDSSLPHGGPGRQPANGNFHLSEFVVNTIPEPTSALLAALGLAALAGWRRLIGRGQH